MNLEEARNVFWLKNNHKTLGELLDSGFLNQSRLEWAAQKAFDPLLKQAAQVILESKKRTPVTVKAIEPVKPFESKTTTPGFEIGISLEDARVTPWPFMPHKGWRMGELLESKQLSLKDLGFAIENAWDEKIKKAAIALSLVRLEQVVKEPTPSAGFVHIISGGRSYSERRETFFTLLQGMFFGLLLSGSIYLIRASFTSEHDPNAKTITEFISTPSGIISLIIALVIILFGAWLVNFTIDRVTKRLERQIEQYRIGREGEDNAVQLIVQALDGNWYLFRNISLPGKNKADIDLVLVGPSGVWALEVKNLRGEYRNIGENWDYRHGKSWRPASVNPSRQVKNSASRLGNFFKADHINAFVNPAVVWINQDNPLVTENPSVAVWQANHISDEIGNIWQGEKLSKIDREKIIEKLSKLCASQQEKA